MPIPEKITKAVSLARTWWSVSVIVAFFLLLIYNPGWGMLWIFPFALVSYFFMLLAVSLYLSTQLTPEELEEAEKQSALNRERLDIGMSETIVTETMAAPTLEKPKPKVEARTVERIEVSKVSAPIGTYKDQEIYEWVEMSTPGSNAVVRFYFHGPTEHASDGTPLIPIEDGKIYANVNGVLYVYAEPAKN